MKQSWIEINKTVKDGRFLLLCNPVFQDGPHLGYWWTEGNHFVSANSPGWLYSPTHYVDISELAKMCVQ
jgi:hypothetical protein